MQLSATKKLVFCAICVALCVVLPMAFHALGSGTVFLPMHVPVLLWSGLYMALRRGLRPAGPDAVVGTDQYASDGDTALHDGGAGGPVW